MVDYCWFNWPFSHSTHFHLTIDLYLMYVRCQFCVLYSYPSKPSRLYKWLFKSISNLVLPYLVNWIRCDNILIFYFLWHVDPIHVTSPHWWSWSYMISLKIPLILCLLYKKAIQSIYYTVKHNSISIKHSISIHILIFFFLSNSFAIFFMSMLTSVLIEASNRSSE